jgi:hypothetical protein
VSLKNSLVLQLILLSGFTTNDQDGLSNGAKQCLFLSTMAQYYYGNIKYLGQQHFSE